MKRMGQGPLSGVRIVEFQGIGPGPLCGLLLADMGADVVRIDRDKNNPGHHYLCARGKRSVGLDLKSQAGRATALDLVASADAVFEGYRPGVMERLGLGPDICLQRNPKLVYGRMTGWGQTGPYADLAGHDINYIALGGALSAVGSAERPIAPLNLLGDYGGGALYLALGIVAALFEAKSSGKGQVIDCAMVDGAASLMTTFFAIAGRGGWSLPRGENSLDGGAPFYGTYQCADGKWVAVGSLEPEFYAELLKGLELDPAEYPQHGPREKLEGALTAKFATRTRDEWSERMKDFDACFSPVLDLTEAPTHPASFARDAFVQVDGVWEPAPAPRFSRTPSMAGTSIPQPGAHTDEVLAEWLQKAPAPTA
jgi:alpha-methylacyl-CoA racemase